VKLRKTKIDEREERKSTLLHTQNLTPNTLPRPCPRHYVLLVPETVFRHALPLSPMGSGPVTHWGLLATEVPHGRGEPPLIYVYDGKNGTLSYTNAPFPPQILGREGWGVYASLHDAGLSPIISMEGEIK
jgi:hypothetical protein